MIKKILLISCVLHSFFSVAQTDFRFSLYGSAMGAPSVNSTACSEVDTCFLITPEENNKFGSVFNETPLDLNFNLDLTFCVYLGARDGADGLTFVMKAPGTRSAGGSGGGIGASSIDTSVIIEFDTYNNGARNSDIPEDHSTIFYNGDFQTAIQGPIILGSGDVEDNNYHTFRINWNAGQNILILYFDGTQVLSDTNDYVSNIFYNNPQVEWGFTASTGGENNRHYICYPKISIDLGPDVAFCDGDSVVLSANPEKISEYYWTKLGEPDRINYWNSGLGVPISDTTIIIKNTGEYVLNVLINGFLLSDTVKSTLVEYAKPVFSGKLVDICPKDPPKVLDADNPGYTYLWEPTGQTTQTISVGSIEHAKYTVTITDDIIQECSIQDSLLIEEYCAPIIDLPNVFTPNRDQINDRFEPIEYDYIDNFVFKIFDSWGRLIYEADNKFSWSGRNSDGQELPQGTYYYIISYTDTKGSNPQKKHGYLTLLR